jgi:hypothetical protein
LFGLHNSVKRSLDGYDFQLADGIASSEKLSIWPVIIAFMVMESVLIVLTFVQIGYYSLKTKSLSWENQAVFYSGSAMNEGQDARQYFQSLAFLVCLTVDRIELFYSSF